MVNKPHLAEHTMGPFVCLWSEQRFWESSGYEK